MSVRDKVQAASDLPYERVAVPEWGENGTPLEFYVHALMGTERDRIEQDAVAERAESEDDRVRNIRARFVVAATYEDEARTRRVFREDDVEWLGRKSAKALDRLYEPTARLSGISKEDVKELAKNSVAAEAADSTSA